MTGTLALALALAPTLTLALTPTLALAVAVARTLALALKLPGGRGYSSMFDGDSTIRLNAAMNFAPVAPSMMR